MTSPAFFRLTIAIIRITGVKAWSIDEAQSPAAFR